MSAIEKLIDVIEHLVSTHPTWNQSMSQVEAATKVAEAKAEVLEPEAAKTVEDGIVVADDVKKDVPPVVDDLKALAEEAGK